MVIYNAATRELTAKIVYYGPGLGGKTTNLQVLHDRLEPSTVGKLLNLSTHTDRTIYFDLLPVELGDIKGYKIRFQLATVPGQTAFNETRKVVLKGADGVVFVADSQWTMLPKNLEAWQNLKDNLKANGVAFEGMPVVIQYNKRDLTDILSVDAVQEALGLSSFPFVEAVASAGRGVTETFKLISKLTFVDLLRRLQGRRPEEASLPPAKETSKDDLNLWRQSLFTRVDAKEPRRPRPLAAVPSPSEEAPFETAEPPANEPAPAAEEPFLSRETAEAAAHESDVLEVVDEVEPVPATAPAGRPAELRTPPTPPAREPESRFEPPPAAAAAAPVGPSAQDLADLESRLEARIEARLKESLPPFEGLHADLSRLDAASGVLASRLEIAERQASESAVELRQTRQALETRMTSLEERGAADHRELSKLAELGDRAAESAARLDGHEQRLEAGFGRLEAQERRLDAQDKRQRALEDDVGMALTSLTERAERLQQQIAGFATAVESLQAALYDRTNQGRVEAEDIRSQLAPLLEAHGQRHAADERMLSEIDRLRESLADSLADLSEHLRRAVRGL